MNRRCALVLFAALGIGCSGSNEPSIQPGSVRGPVTPNVINRPKPKPRWYDAEGALLPSEERIAGLQLPVSLEPVLTRDKKHVFRTKVPLNKVLEYFGPVLFTGKVERVGQGAIYRKATPKGVHQSQVKLDVSILPLADGSTRVTIVEFPTEVSQPAGADDVKARLHRATRMLD